MKAKRVIWTDRDKVEIEHFEFRDPGPGEVLVRTICTLISPGTERAWLLGLDNTPQKYPQYPGYNHVGEVLAAGAGVENIKIGDRVATTGGHASHVVIPADRAFLVPKNVSAENASFWNMATICMQGIRKARIELGESVVILGQGLIGNLALQLAKLSGGLPVIGVDKSDHRLSLSHTCGADATVSPDNSAERIKELTGGNGAAVVIEATGAPEPINQAFKLAAWHGRVVLLASTRGENEKVNFYRDVHAKALIIYGAHNGSRPKQESSPGFWTVRDDAMTVLKLLAEGRLEVNKLISHRFRAEKAPEAYKHLTAWSETLMGAILEWAE